MPQPQFIPWRQISSWRCLSCGRCCKDYGVVLNFLEWLTISQNFGAQTTVKGIDNLFLKRQDDGSCTFLCHFAGDYLCALQNLKPNACKIWPFKVLAEPKYGQPKEAAFNFAGKTLFLYADGNCSGLRYGNPTWEFSTMTLREFAGIAVGVYKQQRSSTRRSARYGRRIV